MHLCLRGGWLPAAECTGWVLTTLSSCLLHFRYQRILVMCHGVRRHQVPRRGGRGSVMSHLQWGAGGASAGRYLFSIQLQHSRTPWESDRGSACVTTLWVCGYSISLLQDHCVNVSHKGPKWIFIKKSKMVRESRKFTGYIFLIIKSIHTMLNKKKKKDTNINTVINKIIIIS